MLPIPSTYGAHGAAIPTYIDILTWTLPYIMLRRLIKNPIQSAVYMERVPKIPRHLLTGERYVAPAPLPLVRSDQ
ncbi:hypothetical protein E2C01_041668 [Portunus trituberculatus]|uniref:Uncharacterized protein n=1 Tax=Portunus trituberculatus TaxID=210409 RepID=A0A5B7FRB5_PORTR|nr:hypothetical protein [Portunus trituberculatus]